jgi:hypothetical protein
MKGKMERAYRRLAVGTLFPGYANIAKSIPRTKQPTGAHQPHTIRNGARIQLESGSGPTQ